MTTQSTVRRHFARRLIELRQRAGIATAHEMAVALGMEPQTYRRYERGETEPNYELLVRICIVLRCTPNDLLIG